MRRIINVNNVIFIVKLVLVEQCLIALHVKIIYFIFNNFNFV